MTAYRILLLCLVLCLALPASALAQEGLISLPEENYTECIAADSEDIYISTHDATLYRWQHATQRLTRLPRRDGLPRYESIIALCVLEGRVYGRLYDDDGLRLLWEPHPGGAGKIALPLGSSYLVRMQTRGDALWLMQSISGDDHVLCRVDMTSGKLKRYDESRGLYQYVLLPDDKVLLIDNLFEKGRLFGRLRMLDLKTGRAQRLRDTDYTMGTPAYDAQSGQVLWVAQGALWRWDMAGEPQRLVAIPVGNEHDHNHAVAIQGKLAIPYSGGIYLVDPQAQAAGSLHVIGDGTMDHHGSGYKQFLMTQPGIALSNAPTAANQDQFGTGELAQRIMTGDLQFDVMRFATTEYDLGLLIDKGYCADISDDPELVALVSRMYPAFAAQVTREGKLYALPSGAQAIDMMSVNRYGLERTMLKRDGLPGSWQAMAELSGDFGSYLKDGEEVAPFEENAGKALKYHSIRAYVYRLLSRGEPLRFDDPAFPQMLENIERQGLPRQSAQLPFLFTPISELLNDDALPLSVFEQEAPVQPVRMWVYIVSAKSQQQQAARRYLRTAAEALFDHTKAYLFPDWSEPIEYSGYAQDVADWQLEQARLQEALSASGEGTAAQREAQDRLQAHQEARERIEAWRYRVSPEDLRHYQQQIAPHLFVASPNVFTDWSQQGAVLLQKEINRYLEGQLDARQLAASLDQMSRLMELEQR